MTQRGVNWGICAGLWAMSALLAACSVSEPLAIESSRQDVNRAAALSVALALPKEEAGHSTGTFAQALQQSMIAKGMTVSADGRMIADYAISTRDASVGALESKDRQGSKMLSDDDGAIWISAPRNDRLLDGCDAQLMRATLILIDRSSGTLAYRGQGKIVECDFDDTSIVAMADGLVADYLAKATR